MGSVLTAAQHGTRTHELQGHDLSLSWTQPTEPPRHPYSRFFLKDHPPRPKIKEKLDTGVLCFIVLHFKELHYCSFADIVFFLQFEGL